MKHLWNKDGEVSLTQDTTEKYDDGFEEGDFYVLADFAKQRGLKYDPDDQGSVDALVKYNA